VIGQAALLDLVSGTDGFRRGVVGARSWLLRRFGYAAFAIALFVALLIVSIALDSGLYSGGVLAGTLGSASPLVLAAMAETPAILGGGGGMDLSVGPFMGFINAIVVVDLAGHAGLTSPWLIIPLVLAMGLLSGVLTGLLVTVVRLQPVVVTLGTYLVFSGVVLGLVPQPTGTAPAWLSAWSGTTLGIPTAVIVVAAVSAAWLVVTRLPIYEHLIAAGSSDRCAYAAGVNVNAVRVFAYAASGLIAGVAGLAVSGLLGAADATVGPPYTLTAIAAVALGGVSLAGGRGGMLGAVIGGCNIFLIQIVLTDFNASPYMIELAYGVVLVLAIVLNTVTGRRWLGASP
jgi:ribose transport system permease protein